MRTRENLFDAARERDRQRDIYGKRNETEDDADDRATGDSLGKSSSALRLTTSQGLEILSNLTRQNEFLSSTKNRLNGLVGESRTSSSLSNTIFSRHRMDQLLVYGGSLLFILLVLSWYFFWGSKK